MTEQTKLYSLPVTGYNTLNSTIMRNTNTMRVILAARGDFTNPMAYAYKHA